jgi:hypothetical protein
MIHLETFVTHCWVCGWSSRSLVPLLSKFGTQEDLREFKEKFLVGNEGRSSKEEQSDVLKSVILPKDFKLVVLASQSDPDVKAVRRYLRDRSVDENDIWYYRLGVSFEPRWRRRVIVPSFNSSGNLNYFVGRAVDKSNSLRYDNVDVPKIDVIFNEVNIKWNRPLVVCEGPFDMFKCGENATCLLGSEFNENHALFEKIVLNSTPVAVAIDSDMKDKAERIVKKLREYDVPTRMVDLGSNHDPGAMSKEDFRVTLSDAKEWTWDRSFRSRLSRVVQRF